LKFSLVGFVQTKEYVEVLVKAQRPLNAEIVRSTAEQEAVATWSIRQLKLEY